MKYVATLLFSLSALVAACTGEAPKDQKEVERCATSFAEAYYNCQLNAAGRLATGEALRQLTFVGSNITQEDIDLLNSQSEQPNIEIEDCRAFSDTLWRVRLTIHRFLVMDSIGAPLQLCDKGEAELSLVKRDNKWLVKSITNGR